MKEFCLKRFIEEKAERDGGVDNIKVLRLISLEIQDISPIRELGNLEKIDLSDNKIKDLTPLSGLNNLAELWLHNNQIEDLSPLSGLSSLNDLYLYNNQIVDISPLSELTNLKELSLLNNKIQDVSHLYNIIDNLETLYLGDNPATEFSECSNGKDWVKWIKNKRKLSSIPKDPEPSSEPYPYKIALKNKHAWIIDTFRWFAKNIVGDADIKYKMNVRSIYDDIEHRILCQSKEVETAILNYVTMMLASEGFRNG